MSHERFDRKVDGMICPQCEDEIAHRLLHTRGVLSCTASYRKSTVTADFDPDILCAEDIGRILAETGYPVGDGRSGRRADAIALVLVACLYFAVPALTGLVRTPGAERGVGFGALFVIGLLTGVMPCGALSAMWLYAMSSGSAARGALVMLVFSLGTVPLLFLFGALQSFLPRGWMKYIVKGSAVLVVTLGLSMLVKGIRLFGM